MDNFKEDSSNQLNDKLNETRMKLFNMWESCNLTGLKQKYGESLKMIKERCFEIYEEEKEMYDKVQLAKMAIAEQNALVEKMQEDIQIANQKFESDEKQKQEVLEKIEQLKEEFAKKQEFIYTHNQENKAKLKELNRSAELFKRRMGLEIRRVYGEQLQFIFKYINSKNPEQLFTFLLKFNEEGNYEVMSCDPPLECMPLLQEKLKETNNFPAFLANVRKAFIALV
ncbi:kinetochore protein Spc25 isoform X2 [Narcine bancroftii]